MPPVVTDNSSGTDVQLEIVERQHGPKFDLHSIKIGSHVTAFTAVAVYESEEEMRFGPRSLDARTAQMVQTLAAERRPLPEPPLPLD